MKKLALLGGLGITLMCCGVFGLMFGGIRSSLKGSDPYRRGVLRATQDPRTQTLLGTPIEVGWMVSGELSTENGRSTADLKVPLDGPTRAATLHIQAHADGSGEWTWDTLKVGTLDLLKD